MEEDIDDHPDYDTLQFADKKDVFKTGFTSKGVRIEKEAPQKKRKEDFIKKFFFEIFYF